MNQLQFYFTKKFEFQIFARGTFEFGRGEFDTDHWIVGIQGPSGIGKTTFLRWLAGLDQPHSGQLKFSGTVWENDHVFLSPQRRRLGWLGQGDPIFPHLSVRQNVGYGLRRLSSADRANRVKDVMDGIGITALADRRIAGLSGGEKRCVGLAQILAVRPQLLLLDEPFTGLDEESKFELMRYLLGWIKTHEVPTVLVSHSTDELKSLSTKIVYFRRDQNANAVLDLKGL